MMKLLRTAALAAIMAALPAVAVVQALPKIKKVELLQAMPVPVGMFKGASKPPPAYIGSTVQATSVASINQAGVAIGTAHSSRIVVIGISSRAADVSAVTIGGVSATQAVATTQTNARCSIWYAAVPTGTTATITATLSTSTYYTILTWALYPSSSTPVDAVGVGNATGTTAQVLDVAKTAGGFFVAIGMNNTGSAGDTTFAGTGAETPTENYDAFSNVMTAGYSFAVTATTTTDDYTITFAASGQNKSLCAASWGP